MSQQERPKEGVVPREVFCVVAPQDAPLFQQLEAHLSLLKRQGLVSLWQERLITPGTDWAEAIDTHLEQAAVVLLLVSSNFFASDYHVGVELQRALERHTANKACVIPIIVRPCDWQIASFAHLQWLPREGKPITSWKNRDAAWTEVAAEIRRVIEALPRLTTSAPRAPLPSVWNIPYPRNPFFLGRDALFTQIRAHVQAGHTAALSQPQAISGLGGIGKTQIAVEYAYRFHQEYETVLWARAESQEALVVSYTELASLLNLPGREAQAQELVIEAVKTWLQRHRSWLLLLDNADDLDLLPAFLPPSFGGHILLTTRAWDMQRLAQRVEVESLPSEVGALFLLRRAGRLPMDAPLTLADPQERALACQVAEQMGGLPLALDQAGAYLEATGMNLQTYQQVYQQHRQTLHQRRGARVPDHPEPVATTWALSLTRVESQDHAAAELLQLCAFLAPDAIPEELLTQGATHLGPVLAPMVSDAFRLGEAIAVLRTYSLIQRDPQSRTFSLHRLVQAVVNDNMDEASRTRWKERVLNLLAALVPGSSFADWSAWERLLGHILTASVWMNQEALAVVGGANLLRRTGWYLIARARYREAEPLLESVLERNVHEDGDEHPNTAGTLYQLGSLYQGQGRYEQAESLYQRALRISEASDGPENPNSASILHQLGYLYQEQGRYKQAESLYQRALRISEHALGLGPEHPDTAATLHELARLYRNQSRYEQAEPLYQRALRIQKHALGPEHPNTASTLHELARLHQAQGKYEQAEPLYQQALRIQKHALGLEHPDTGNTLYALASLYRNQSRYEQAESLYQQALRIYEQTLVPEHPNTASTLHALARLYQDQGKYEQAELLYQRALHIYEQALGPEHPSTGTTLHELARLYQAQGKYEQAEPLYQRALRISETSEGPEHPSTATTLHALASLYQDQSKYEQAELLYQRALRVRVHALGPKHARTATTRQHYASLLRSMGRTEEAAQLEIDDTPLS